MDHSASYAAFMNSERPSIKHSTYFEIYDRLFSKFVGKDITFVEVGILEGGSLFMWREFFGPNALIIGVDLNPEAKKWEEHGFDIRIGSQSDPIFWEKLCAEFGPFDILLDDGGHLYEQQIVTVESVLPHIKDGGVLVVEDTHTSYMPRFGRRRFSFIKYVKDMIDRINMRFSKFADAEEERRVWSIEIFESIVAFHINHSAARRKSSPSFNKGVRQHTKDFRYSDERDETSKERAAEIMKNVFPKLR